MNGRQERGSKVADAAVTERGIDRDKTWQVFVLGSESVADPRAHAWSNKRVGPRVHF